MEKKQFVILFILLWSQQSSCILDDIWTAVKMTWKLVTVFNDIMTAEGGIVTIYQLIADDHDPSVGIARQLTQLTSNVHDLTIYTSQKLNRIDEEINEISYETEIGIQLSKVSGFIRKIDDFWNKFDGYRKNNVTGEPLNSLASDILSIEHKLSLFRERIISQSRIALLDHGLFTLIPNLSQMKKNIECGKGHTFHDTLITLFRAVMVTEVKAHFLLSFSQRLQYDKNDAWRASVAELHKSFKGQFIEYIHGLTRQLRNRSLPYLTACDPAQGSWNRGETFFELERLIQQTIYRASPCDPFSVTCPVKPTWEFNKYTGDRYDERCVVSRLTLGSQCDSTPESCEPISSFLYQTKACIAMNRPTRIQWVDSHDVGKQGRNFDTCHGFMVESSTLIGGFCSCRCRSDKWRIFLGKMESKWAENYVIVGMRFNKISNILFIQIAEGKLESNGYISNFSWVKLWDKRLKNENSRLGGIGVDFSLLLHDVQLHSGYALTSIQIVSFARYEHYTIELRGTKFNYLTGKLRERQETLNGKSVELNWYQQQAYEFHELPFRPRSSLHAEAYMEHQVDSENYNVVRFKQSELNDDFGQSTLPFFEQTEVLTHPLSPLGGVGIYHKSSEDYAGFIALRLYPIDYLHFIDDFLETHDLNSTTVWEN